MRFLVKVFRVWCRDEEEYSVLNIGMFFIVVEGEEREICRWMIILFWDFIKLIRKFNFSRFDCKFNKFGVLFFLVY